MKMHRALVIGLPLLALAACSSQPPQVSSARTSSAGAQPGTCPTSQLDFSLNNGNGRFNGMSHSGTTLVLLNTGTSACTIAAQPRPAFTDANRQRLNIAVQDLPDYRPASTPITLAPGATVSSDMRWVSGDVYDHGHCESPAIVTLAIGKQTVAAVFTGHLCGPGGQPVVYTLTPFKPATATAAAAVGAKTLTYTCDDRRKVQAVYPDTDTAVLTLDGQTYRLHTAISADGARYVGEHWQWWTKGMTKGLLAPLKPGESIASAHGVSCATS
jgi:membrane-bound inhibitor of C-type lysozyme